MELYCNGSGPMIRFWTLGPRHGFDLDLVVFPREYKRSFYSLLAGVE